MKRTESGEKKATRQCWECLKRRLVCDHTLPHCKKCVKVGKQCPGYDEQKPLQWVEPGKVTSRRRKKDNSPKVYTIRSEGSVSVASSLASLSIIGSGGSEKSNSSTTEEFQSLGLPIFDEPPVTQEAINLYRCQLTVALLRKENEVWWNSLTNDERERHIELMATEQAAGIDVADRFLKIGNKNKLKDVVRRGQYSEAALILRTERNPLERLQRLLRVMELQDLPSYDHLSNDSCEVIQAVDYCMFARPLVKLLLTEEVNARIYPDTKENDTLAPNPAVISFPIWALHVLPPAVHHTLICLSLNHFIHSLPAGSDRRIIAGNRSKVYKYRGLAIRALSENVAKDNTCTSDLTISSVLMFMAMEVQHSSSGEWRTHAYGMKRLIDLRGGLETLLIESPYLTSALVIFVIIVTFSNSLGPASEQINITDPISQLIRVVETVYSLIFPYILCPPTLFIEIIRISHLRQTVASSPFDNPSQNGLEAQDILARIEKFVPEDWAQPGERHDEWLLLGSIYQSAIALYCIMSLQSVAALPSTLEIDTMRTVYGVQLFEGLKMSAQSKRLRKFLLFPLCVLGVETGYRHDQSIRYWIERRLEDHSRLLGTSSPLKARAVLQRYWQRNKAGWDECFDQPENLLIPLGVC